MTTSLRLALVSLGLAAATTALPAGAVKIDYAIRATTAYQLDGPSDLGLGGGQSADAGIFNFAPRVQFEFSPDVVGYLRGRVFQPTNAIEPTNPGGDPSAQRRVKRFAALDEFWIECRCLTNYPGESLRFGRQLIRQQEGNWISQNADALRFRLSSTLLDIDTGFVRQFSSYRTDNEPVFAPQRDRIYGFASVATDWTAGQRIGFRSLYASDLKNLPPPGSIVRATDKRQDAQLAWLGLYADNGYFEATRPGALLYRASATYLTGTDRRISRISSQFASRTRTESISAYEASTHLRWQPFRVPVQFGLGYALSSGGQSGQYQQSGLQGNASYFTGTPSLISLYNEALRAELGNLRIITSFISYNGENDDLSLIYNNFRKVRGSAPIITDNVNAPTIGHDSDVGNGLDLVATHYFDLGLQLGNLIGSGELAREGQRFSSRVRSNIRLRSSIFDPGAAYGPGTRNQYRVLAEVTLWVN